MAKVKSDILTNDGKHLALFHNGSGISADKTLLKYTEVRKELEERRKQKEKNMPEIKVATGARFVTPEEWEAEDDEPFDGFTATEINKALAGYETIKDGNVRDVNIFISKEVFRNVFSSFNEHVKMSVGELNISNNVSDSLSFSEHDPNKKKKHSFFTKLSELLKRPTKEDEETYSIDVVEFFSLIKGLTKENREKYVNRLVGYIKALRNCEQSGQIALKEKLVRDMVINKYESVLYANDFYYVVTEDQIVDFVKKTKKGVRLTYVKNYMRIIPPEVVTKIEESNKLEIFDNYAILHYDPEALAFGETIQETIRRRDPILFGLICGSNKLYYITDWVDEYCDLTLDKFVETLQIKKDDLKLPEKL